VVRRFCTGAAVAGGEAVLTCRRDRTRRPSEHCRSAQPIDHLQDSFNPRTPGFPQDNLATRAHRPDHPERSRGATRRRMSEMTVPKSFRPSAGEQRRCLVGARIAPIGRDRMVCFWAIDPLERTFVCVQPSRLAKKSPFGAMRCDDRLLRTGSRACRARTGWALRSTGFVDRYRRGLPRTYRCIDGSRNCLQGNAESHLTWKSQ
jgi:hypothetical protein